MDHWWIFYGGLRLLLFSQKELLVSLNEFSETCSNNRSTVGDYALRFDGIVYVKVKVLFVI